LEDLGYFVPRRVTGGTLLPDDHGGSSHVSLRVPNHIIDAFEKLAAMLDRPRSWVMLRALRQYLEDEGAEIAEDVESLAQLDGGEIVSSEDLRPRTKELIAAAEKARPQQK
jgi:predicted transcriptional regulator